TFANGGIDSLPCDFASDVQQVAFETDLRIFPNPVFDLLTIEFKYDHEGVIMLYNALGEQVFSMVIDKQRSVIINFTNYPSGIYFLKTSGKEDFMFSSLILKS
ncbi:MAG: T9SS type A sorting domain-containing protein, partial [Chitinophagales bacterium]